MADLVMSSSPGLVMTTPTGGNGAATSTGMVADSPTVTRRSNQTCSLLSSSSPSSCLGGGGGTTSSSLSNGTSVIPHPQNLNNNGHDVNYIGDENNSSSSSHNLKNVHHSHSNSYSNTSSLVTASQSSPTAGLQHNRNHSHPVMFSNSANNSSNHVDSSSTLSSSEVGNGEGSTVVKNNSSVVTTLPSSLATTMDILNLDFVNGNSSYSNNVGNNELDMASPLSQWSQTQNSAGSHSKVDNVEHFHSMPYNVSNNYCSTGGDSTQTPTNSAKVPGEIPESVMKYLLTKTDSVDSTKSSHSSSGNTASSTSHSSPTAVAALMSMSAPSTSTHHCNSASNNKRLQEFLVDLDTLQSTSEIAKVLENFNAILEKIEQEDDKEALEGLEALTTPLSPSVLQCPTATVSSTSRIKNSVETLAELLLSGCGEEEDEDLLIIIDENDSESLQAGAPVSGNDNCVDVCVYMDNDNNDNAEDDELNDDISSLVEIENELGDLDNEEGYESDRPIVRASMRKLRPVKLLPMPSSSSCMSHHHSQASNQQPFSTPPPTPVTPRSSSPVDANVNLPSNSPSASKIIVTSLMNNLNSPSASHHPPPNISSNIRVDSNPSTSNSGNCSQQRTADNLLTVPGHATSAATCSASLINSSNNSFVPTIDVLHVSNSSTTGNNSQSRCHSRTQSSSSQTIQFHQNLVTITPNPVGFVDVPGSASNVSGIAASGSSTSAQSSTGNVQRGNGAGSSSGNSNETYA